MKTCLRLSLVLSFALGFFLSGLALRPALYAAELATLPPPSPLKRYEVAVLKKFNLKERFFTQGLVWVEKTKKTNAASTVGFLYHSGGGYGESKIARYSFFYSAAGAVRLQLQQVVMLPEDIFAEDLIFFRDSLFLLTWKRGQVYEFDAALRLQRKTAFPTAREGWGLAHDGDYFYTTDGSAEIIVRKPLSFTAVKSLLVRWSGRVVRRLNAMTYAAGRLYVNVWGESYFLEVHPQTGMVTGVVEAGSLLLENHHPDPEAVLNGLAYFAPAQAFFLTGKRWQWLYLVKLVEKKN